MPTATLKYTEWSPTSLKITLSFQYNVSKDCRYITTGHDGQNYPLDNPSYRATTSLFGEEFSSPAAIRHFVCHPWNDAIENNSGLVLFPLLVTPADGGRKRIFLDTQKKAVGVHSLAALTTPVISKIKSLPQTATKSMIDFIRNPIFNIV